MDDQASEVNLPEVSAPELPELETPEPGVPNDARKPPHLFHVIKHKRVSWSTFIAILLAFAIGLSSGYLAWGRETMKEESSPALTQDVPQPTPTAEHVHSNPIDVAALSRQVNPPEGYALPVKLGDLGPQLIAAGAIDYQGFVKVYAGAGQPLNDEQIAILTKGSDQPIVIDQSNAYFWLNFFWAVGLTNQNSILTQGPMMKDGKENIGNFASTGGWTVGAKLPVELYASTQLVTLVAEQQKRLEEVAQNVFRPCCNNPTHFPDCNHGMAMLGLLEVMAGQNATVDEMFKAAKDVNAFWYPQQSLEQAIAFKAAKGLDYNQVDARELTSAQFSSGSGFKAVHQWLANNGLLQQGPGGGNNCGV